MPRAALLSLCLLLVNGAVAWRLFQTEYLVYMGSAEGFYISLAQQISSHWSLIWGWWPLWFCGMPFQNTYQPVLHLLVAAITTATHLSAARCFHMTVAVLYALGPVTLFWLVTALAESAPYGFASALLYSLWSPSALLVPEIRADLGGLWDAQRLHTTVRYGDGPHVASLTLIPLALLALHGALRKPGLHRMALAAAAMALVPLVNLPGAMALAFGVVAYLSVYVLGPGNRHRGASLARVAGIASLAYALGAHWLPPSTLHLVASNTQLMDPAVTAFTSRHFVYLALYLGLTALLAYGMANMGAPKPLMFFAIWACPFALVVLGFYWFHVTMLAQPFRFHLALELALSPALILAARELLRRAPRARVVMAGVFGLFCAVQMVNYVRYTQQLVREQDIARTSDFKVAAWIRSHTPEQERVLVPGSMALWLNAFAPNPQFNGCCEQTLILRSLAGGLYEYYNDVDAGPRAAEISEMWLKAAGVAVIATAGRGSTETSHAMAHPDKFKGRFEELWRDGDDAIFRVPLKSTRLAHVIPHSALVARPPENGLYVEPLVPYTQALDRETPLITRAEWLDARTFRIEGSVPPGDAISVQIAWHPGWRASVGGKRIKIGRDGLGFMTLSPATAAPVQLDLIFDGGAELRVLNILNVLGIAVFLVMLTAGAPGLRRGSAGPAAAAASARASGHDSAAQSGRTSPSGRHEGRP